jgi:transcriptional regulator
LPFKRRRTARLYTPAHFRETRIEVLQALIRAHPLALLIAQLDTGLCAEHLPMQLARADDEPWRLRGHVARANPLWRRLPAGSPVLTVFRGADHYVSPSWYPSKQQHGQAVPTWNYAAVHLSGTIRFIEDPAWLLALVESLTDEHEHGRLPRWQVADAPADYRDEKLRAIVGFEIAVTGFTGKFKSSQNRPAADRAEVVQALRAEGVTDAALAELVRDPGA